MTILLFLLILWLLVLPELSQVAYSAGMLAGLLGLAQMAGPLHAAFIRGFFAAWLSQERSQKREQGPAGKC